jgi:hypothetical protein
MAVDNARIESVVAYALAVARCAHDEVRSDQELAEIHLVKYVYLADLAAAEATGDTYTGTAWQFFHFGPWAPEVSDALDAAADRAGADARAPGERSRDAEARRWRIADYEAAVALRDRLDRVLPSVVSAAVRTGVRRFGSATSELLHYVYGTGPMLRAAPRDVLVFSRSTETEPLPSPDSGAPTAALRPKAAKRRAKRLEQAKERFRAKARERIDARAALAAQQPPPRFDGVFDEGLRRLDALAGASLEGRSGTLEFEPSVWTSAARAGQGDE